MILSDFLSRQEIDKSDLHEIIPISFDMKAILYEKYYNKKKRMVNIWFKCYHKLKIEE